MPIKVLNEFLPNAEEARLGAIKVGDTLEIDQEEGVLNVDPTSVIGLYYSNCITEIAQDVKLEIVSGNAILKAGSRVYIPAGNNNTFNLYTTETDLQLLYIGGLNGRYFIQLHADTTQLVPEYLTIQSGDTFPENPTSLQKFYKSDENLVYSYDATRTVWKPANISLPLAIINIENGEVKDITQVFNGTSYFGHHAFILPGLKGVAPDGITERGYVKSINIEVDDIKVFDLTEGDAYDYNNVFLFLDPALNISRQYYDTVDRAKELVRNQNLIQYAYQENRDYIWTGTSYTNPINLPIVECSLKSSVITYFRILQPLRIATVSDVKESTDSFLFDYKWADHIPNKLSWLRADTFSWQDGNIYKAAYNHLVNDYNNRIIGDEGDQGDGWYKETISGQDIWYVKGPDGHKICVADNENAVQAIYNSTGVAWYYILDRANTKFKLPRTKFGFTGIRDGVGRYVAPGLPNITGRWWTRWNNDVKGFHGLTADGAFYDSYSQTSSRPGRITAEDSSNSGTRGYPWFDASRSNPIYGASSTVQSPATQMYLYCYVGRADQDALEKSEIDIAAITNNSLNQITSTKNTSLTEINTATEEGINRLNTDSNALNRTQITNCITEIPQDIKLEIVDGVITLKAGSKLYIPNGFESDGTTLKFDEFILPMDYTFPNDQSTTSTNSHLTGLGDFGANRYRQSLNYVFSGSTAPSTSEGGMVLWYDTTNNVIKRWIDNTWQANNYTLPVGITTWNNNIPSINQVFNGFGYIGSTIFLLPGVKFLLPNGLNTDGTANSIEYTTSNVTVRTRTWTTNFTQIACLYNDHIEFENKYIESNTEPSLAIDYLIWYNPQTNKTKVSWNDSIWHDFYGIYLAHLGADGSTTQITSMEMQRKAFQAVDATASDYVVCYQKPNASNKYTWYRLYKSGWVEQGGLSDVTNASTSAGTFYITLPIAMQDLNYTALCHYNWETTGDWSGNLSVKQYSTTQLKVSKRTSIQCKTSWIVKGFAAGYQ